MGHTIELNVFALDPPGPSQVNIKFLVPAEEMFITSVPEVPYVPDQSPVAEQEVALFELH